MSSPSARQQLRMTSPEKSERNPFGKSSVTPRSPSSSIRRTASSPELKRVETRNPQKSADDKKILPQRSTTRGSKPKTQIKVGKEISNQPSIPGAASGKSALIKIPKADAVEQSPSTFESAASCLTSSKEDPAPSSATGNVSKDSSNISEMSLDVINLAANGLRLVDPLKGNITSKTRESLMAIFTNIIEMATNVSKKTHQQETSFLKEKIALLQKSTITATISSGQPTASSYAAIAASGPSHAVIVSSLDKTKTTSDIKATLRQEVRPSDLKVGVSAMIATKDNKVIIKCPTSSDADTIRAALPRLTKGNLVAKEGKRLTPTVILKGIEKETADDEIIEYILQQNDSIFEVVGQNKDAIKLQRIIKNRKSDNLRNAVLLVNNDVREVMLSQERISIGFQRVRVEDSCPLMQCFKCMGYGHSAARCTESKDRCLHCAGDHKSFECTKKEQKEEFRCWNCVKMAKGKTEATKHRANDRECPYRLKMMQRTLERVNYG
jgi:hypothetical protein